MFWSELESFQDNVAVIEGQHTLTYAELADRCDELATQFDGCKKLVFVFVSNNSNGLVAYLTCLREGHVCMMLDPDLDNAKVEALLTAYQPNFIIRNLNVEKYANTKHTIDNKLALLLSTSGTTGSAKQVSLSYNNIQSNADAICDYLPIRKTDKTVSTLPLFYSYGLSVINSHLNRGAAILFTQYSIINREFWQLFESERINSFAGVPHIYDMLLRIKFTELPLNSLRYFTQAGGRLAENKVRNLAEYAQVTSKQFFVMYGQTEATARMSYLEPDLVLMHPESIGKAIPKGKFELLDSAGKQITKPGEVGEISYVGPNVMLGYVNSKEELVHFHGDGSLATGDLGYFDEQGLHYIVGRKKRMIKLFGNRLNLDEVEQYFNRQGIEAASTGNDQKLVVAFINELDISSLKKKLSQYLNIHSSVIIAVSLSEFPLTANGKKDYAAILSQVGLSHD